MKPTKQGYVVDRSTDYDGNLPSSERKIREMQEQMDVRCKYLAPVGQTCLKCHSVHVSPFKRPIS